MCDSNANTTTSTTSTSLPGGLADAINSASAGALAAYKGGNPTASIGPAPVAPLNDWQNWAAGTTANVAGYQPQQIGASYSPQTVTPGSVTQFGSPTVSGSQIQSYMNPYTSSVIGTSLDQLNRQLAQTNQTASGQAASAGAFGGDRAAIVQTENARNANQIAAQTISGLNSQNYTQAAGLAEQDATRALTAGTSQAQLDASTGEANQYAGIQAANLNSSNQRANQSAGLAGAQLNLAGANQEGQLGAQFRQTTQDNLTSGYNQAYTNAYWPISSVSTLAGQLGSLSSAAPRTTSTTSTAPGQSPIGQAAGLGTAALGLNSLVPGGLAAGLKSLIGGSSAGSGSFDQPWNVDTSSIGSAGFGGAAPTGDVSGLFEGGGGDIPWAARGGLVGYANGGQVQPKDSRPIMHRGRVVGLAHGASSDDVLDATYDPATGTYVSAPMLPTAARTAPTGPRNGLAAYADGGSVADGSIAPMSPGSLVPTNPSLQFDDPEAAATRAAADQHNALFTSTAADAAALVAGDDRNPGVPPEEAARMATARAASSNRLSPDITDKLHQAVRNQLGVQGQAPVSVTAPAAVAPPAPVVNTGLAAAVDPTAVPDAAQPAVPSGGLADAAPASALDQALSVNPAAIVQGSAQPSGAIPIDQMPAPEGSGLAGAALGASSNTDISAPPGQGGLATAAASVDPGRLARSADPAAIIPGGFQTPAAPAPASTDPMHNRTGMALLAAGLGMMASKSHTALGAIGEGGLAGVQQLDTMTREQNASDARRATLAQTAAYQQGMLGVRGTVAANGTTNATTNQFKAGTQADAAAAKAAHYDAQDAATQDRTDAYVQKSLAAAAKSGQPTSASAQQAAMTAFQQANPGATAADAWNYIKGFATRDTNAAARLGLQQQKFQEQTNQNATTNDQRERNQQRLGNNNEDASVRGMMFNNPKLTYAAALSMVRNGRAAAGPAPLPAPIRALSSGAPVQVNTPADAMNLPSGAQFVTPDGRVMVRH